MIGLTLGVSVLALAAGVVALTRSGHEGPPGDGWVWAASMKEVASAGVLKVPGRSVYLVMDGETPLALSTVDPHLGHDTITYCESSGWFEDEVHGEKFDGHGYYMFGPSPRGMDRVKVFVLDGDIWIQPTTAIQGPARDATAPADDPDGPFCS